MPRGREVPVEKLDLQDDPELISPPVIDEPLYACAEVVHLVSFLPQAELIVEFIDRGETVSQVAGWPEPAGALVTASSQLLSGEGVRARQRAQDGRISDWSPIAVVREYTEDYPAGPPRPVIQPAPVHNCGVRTGVGNLLIDADVWITQDGTNVGNVKAYDHQSGINVHPPYTTGQEVVAWTEFCGDQAPPSPTEIAQPAPSPLPTPVIGDVYEGGQQVVITSLANGAQFEIERGGMLLGPWPTWGQAHLVGLNPPFVAGEKLRIRQFLCPDEPPSPTGETTVQPCSQLPAPELGPVQHGDTVITITQSAPGAVITIFVDFQKAGEGSSSSIALNTTLKSGQIIHAIQRLGDCVSNSAWEVTVACVDPPIVANPAWRNLFPVGWTDYEGTPVSIDGISYPVRGRVYYPAQADGENEPFYDRLTDVEGEVPIVFIAHGNHRWEAPSYLGYQGFQRMLARQGFVAVSVDCNLNNRRAIEGLDGFWDNMVRRAQVINASIEHFRGLHLSGHALFGGRIDLERVGLMGHSRGGDAVSILQHLPTSFAPPTLVNAEIRAVLSLAPTAEGAEHFLFPRNLDYLTILPAADGDVKTTEGSHYYDMTEPSGFRSQLYIEGAIHNRFNTVWEADGDDNNPADLLSGFEHRTILDSYGAAFFQAALQGQNTRGFLSGHRHPAGVTHERIHLSFSWARDRVVIVDDHEESDGPGSNSLGMANGWDPSLMPHETDARLGGNVRWSGAINPGDPTYYGRTVRMELNNRDTTGVFRFELDQAYDLVEQEIWIRAGEVHPSPAADHLPSTDGLVFELGIDHGAGVDWVSSAGVGGVPPIYPHNIGRFRKTMLTTLRFPASCFIGEDDEIGEAKAILVRPTTDPEAERTYVIDDLQLVPQGGS